MEAPDLELVLEKIFLVGQLAIEAEEFLLLFCKGLDTRQKLHPEWRHVHVR